MRLKFVLNEYRQNEANSFIKGTCLKRGFQVEAKSFMKDTCLKGGFQICKKIDLMVFKHV